jgi:hypothetical protein
MPGANPSLPYLLAVGPPPMRFAQSLPLPDVSTRPPSAAPPVPAIVEEIAAANAASAKSVGSHLSSPVASPDIQVPEPASTSVASGETAKSPPAKTPAALIPDETQHELRPEEILPFFQLPGANGATTIVVPAVPASPEQTRLPVSTAVYRQR